MCDRDYLLLMNKRVNSLRANRNSRSAYKGVTIRKDLRLAVYLRDSFTCLYCCADLHSAHPMDVTLDHLKPHCSGGHNGSTNLITACRSCNCSRGDKPVSRFAGPEALQHINRNRKRSINRYRKLAKAIILGEISDPRK